ncbi:MAG: tetratricopeptide repeat protein [Methanoregulaceae archaeon]|nr:tetratricopeptide repeat protein [Methanoregulaceae archaeon]MCU0629088.1 tetratricopeptide repeat protein [Methanoregulaceae archaeon]
MAVFLIPTTVSGDSPSEIAASYIQKGDDLTLKKQYLEALEAYEAAVASDPYNSIAWNKLGIAHMNTGRYQDAVTAFEKALTIDPFYPEAWNNKGDSLLKLGEYDDAISAYDQALLLNPNDLYALLRKGTSLQESGSPAEAMLIYQEVISLAEKEVRKHPDYARFDAKLWANKAEALYRLGRYPEAVEAYSAALAINPKYDRALQGKIHAEEEILRARGSPTTTIPATEGNIVDIGLTNLPVSFPVLLGALVAAVFLLRIRQQKK